MPSSTARHFPFPPSFPFSNVFAAVALSLVVHGVAAQTAPDAGSLRQQFERDRALPLPRKVAPERLATPEPMQPASGVSITVKQFRFTGNTLLSAAQLAPALAPYLNRPLNFTQLEGAAAEVANTYRNAGWLVRAFLPKQDVTDGALTIHIVEARFGGASLDGVEPRRATFAQIQRIFATQQPTGALLNADALDRALLLADDLPGVAVAGNLVQGQNEGETGISLKLSDEALASVDTSLDNDGSRSTGAERLNATLYLNSPAGWGDQLIATATHTEGSDYLRTSTTVPLGNDGWRTGASVSTLRYRLVAPEFAALNGKGTSDSVGLEASYPLIRSRARNLNLHLNVERKRFNNESIDQLQSDYTSTSASVGLSGNSFDTAGGGGANSASLTLVAGSMDLGSLQVGENPEREGSFTKLRYALSRQQTLSSALSLYGNLSGQSANTTLDSSEKLSLGGSGGVRAYPSGEGSGSSGQLAALELRWRVTPGATFTGFYDWGHVSNDDGSPSYSLQGAGLGVSWQTPVGATVKAVWAHRIGDNPNPTATGTDQDGTLSLNRWWFTASLPF
jgi:hemolysin activation/secretion protein